MFVYGAVGGALAINPSKPITPVIRLCGISLERMGSVLIVSGQKLWQAGFISPGRNANSDFKPRISLFVAGSRIARCRCVSWWIEGERSSRNMALDGAIQAVAVPPTRQPGTPKTPAK